jgi:hypothetical protein
MTVRIPDGPVFGGSLYTVNVGTANVGTIKIGIDIDSATTMTVRTLTVVCKFGKWQGISKPIALPKKF